MKQGHKLRLPAIPYDAVFASLKLEVDVHRDLGENEYAEHIWRVIEFLEKYLEKENGNSKKL